MLDLDIMNKKPKNGYKFIYRYYDDDGSYIGQTKKPLKVRAGKDGKSYCVNDSKWSQAILEKGFNSFNVEILCECLEADADNEEKKYIKQFDSRNNGYNSTPGGIWYNPDWAYDTREYKVVDLNSLYNNMSNKDVYYACKLVEKLFGLQTSPSTNYDINMLDKYYRDITDIIMSVTYYAFEGDFETRYCNGLEYLENYLGIAGKGLSLWRSIYFDMSGKAEAIRSNSDYAYNLSSFYSNQYNYEQRKLEENKITEAEVAQFIEHISSSELLNYFDQSCDYMKDLSCGDCVSLGVLLKYKFLQQ